MKLILTYTVQYLCTVLDDKHIVHKKFAKIKLYSSKTVLYLAPILPVLIYYKGMFQSF